MTHAERQGSAAELHSNSAFLCKRAALASSFETSRATDNCPVLIESCGMSNVSSSQHNQNITTVLNRTVVITQRKQRREGSLKSRSPWLAETEILAAPITEAVPIPGENDHVLDVGELFERRADFR